MPTFARLVAAVLYAALGVGVALLCVKYFDEGTPLDKMYPAAAVGGAFVGWAYTGKVFGRSRHASVVSVGLTSAVVQALLVIGGFSSALMLKRATRNAFSTVPESIAGVFEAALEYLEIIGKADVIGAALVGGVVAASVTKWVAARTR